MATTLLTADDLLRLPDDGRQHELVRGELRSMTPAGFRHGAISALITGLLTQHARANDSGVIVTEATGFRLASDPDTVRCPDVAFVDRSRIPPDGPGAGFFEGAPDLAIEVLSPDDTVFEVEEKVEQYLAAGTRDVWVVNPKLRRVTIYRGGGVLEVLHESDTLDGGAVLPGFVCPVREIFTWPT
jgi:Uma2 family endonuclease